MSVENQSPGQAPRAPEAEAGSSTKGPSGRVQRVLDRLAPARLGGRMGLAVVALGLVIIGIGWNGAAGSGGEINHVPLVQAQLPWLLSGGFLGLAIVVLGAALIIASAYRESQARLKASIDALVETFQQASSAGVAPSDLGDLVVGGSASYHLRDCPLVSGRGETRLLTVGEAANGGLTPCRVCHPPVPADAPL